MTNQQSEWHVHLNNFEGPLELLLKLIKDSQMDIYDIQISQITNQYNEHLKHMKKLNINIAGEYFVMSAKLMNIKAKMLLPTYDDDFNEVDDDPRLDLVQQLLEYKHYKNLANDLEKLINHQASFYTPNINHLKFSDNILNADVDILSNMYNELLHKKKLKNITSSHNVKKWNFSIENQTKFIIKKLKPGHKINFLDLFDEEYELEEVVTNFLAILQMSKNKIISLSQDNDILYLTNIS
ncbi:segregation/condensation protein A [Apilactobacillus sp. TMW 2.2459]|uniref:segregation and condensation protein A n=1 Tax=Apilactobacillus xinyiensis TaxID=2841032 RepID=UPI00200FCA46|nr:segregation/condensation protein A [Apilactobacillus xinyiensis]MCL0311671.1 segregation/condensation protein A [Apilactobacillus xinyiensis]